MSFELIVNDKPVGQVGTIKGFNDMADFCDTHGGKECRSFFVDGQSTKPQELRKELSSLLRGRNKPSADIARSLRALSKLLEGARGTVMVSC